MQVRTRRPRPASWSRGLAEGSGLSQACSMGVSALRPGAGRPCEGTRSPPSARAVVEKNTFCGFFWLEERKSLSF